MNLKINHGASWLYFAIEDLPAFARSFFKVWSGCLKKEPFLLFFLLLNIPLLAAKKLGRQFRNPERSLSGRDNQRA